MRSRELRGRCPLWIAKCRLRWLLLSLLLLWWEVGMSSVGGRGDRPVRQPQEGSTVVVVAAAIDIKAGVLRHKVQAQKGWRWVLVRLGQPIDLLFGGGLAPPAVQRVSAVAVGQWDGRGVARHGRCRRRQARWVAPGAECPTGADTRSRCTSIGGERDSVQVFATVEEGGPRFCRSRARGRGGNNPRRRFDDVVQVSRKGTDELKEPLVTLVRIPRA